MINWKPVTEIPTVHWAKNYSISPRYLVKCGYDTDGKAILGYTNYSFATHEWMDCYRSTEYGIHKPIEWTDDEI